MKGEKNAMETPSSNPYSVKLKPQRFIIHVSSSINREAINDHGIIAKQALNEVASKGVFAHNSMNPDYFWFPFIFNDYTGNYSELDDYDFWVIDTHKTDNTWFIDTCGVEDFLVNINGASKQLYIMTKTNISREAITLYKFQTDCYWEYKGNGAIHFRSKPRFRAFEG